MTSEPTEEVPPTRRTPATDDFPTGPEVGATLRDFTLPDQHGRTVNFTQERAGQPAVVVFHRSVRW